MRLQLNVRVAIPYLNGNLEGNGDRSSSTSPCKEQESLLNESAFPQLRERSTCLLAKEATSGIVQTQPWPDWKDSFKATEAIPEESKGGGRVRHLVVEEGGLLTDVVAVQLQMPKILVHKLLQFGSIFTCRIPPTLPEPVRQGWDQERYDRFLAQKELAREAAGPRPGLDIPRRCMEDVVVEENSFIRIHCQPKRFPAAHRYDWKARVLYESERYVVINKPPCVPAAPVVDNILECAPALTSKALGRTEALWLTSRLDHCTEGLLVLGKDQNSTAMYHHLLSSCTPSGEPCVGKHYRALSFNPPPLGTLRHYLMTCQKSRERGPFCSLVHPDGSSGAKRSELVVHKVEKVGLIGEASARWGDEAYESWIELKTGRTHQIRAQLAACGAPLCGDTLYAAIIENLVTEVPEAPKEAIGLQCAQLRVCNIDFKGRKDVSHLLANPIWETFTAGAPWWRNNADVL